MFITNFNQKKNLILTLSLGLTRNFIDSTKNNLKRYADKTNSDFVIITDDSDVINDFNNQFNFDIKVGRKNGKAYVLKIYLIYKYLEIYDKVLWLDDTCLIKVDTENLFDITNNFDIAGYNEGINIDLKSWKYDKNFIKQKMNFILDTTKYINSGVVIYNKTIRDHFSPQNIIKHIVLLESAYPHQAFLNYLIQKYNLSLYLLDESYNTMFLNTGYNLDEKKILPEQINLDNIIIEKNKIFHITGFYTNRFDLLVKLNEIFINYNL